MISKLFVNNKLFFCLLDNSSKDTILTNSMKSPFTFSFIVAYIHHPRSGTEF